jgi:hypothetical protein
MNSSEVNSQPVSSAKKPYTSPKLVEYGTVSKLTQTGTGSGTDGGSGTMAMVCL